MRSESQGPALESALVKYKNTLVSLSRGNPTTVDFNWDEIWTFRKRMGDGFMPSLLSLYHVHPSGFLRYTDIDLKMIKSYTLTFGFPISFSIVCFKTPIIGDLEHKMITYRYKEKRMVKEEMNRLRYVELQILKELSYGLYSNTN